MFCPQCKAEYRAGFTRCSDCGVKLEVPAIHALVNDQPNAGSHAEPSAVLWRGQDPVCFSVVLSALDDAGISYKELQRRDYAAALSQPFALSFYGLPHWEVRVCISDVTTARSVVEEALRPVSALAVEANWTNDGATPTQSEIESSQYPEHAFAPVKVWSGDVFSVAEELRDVFTNEGIRYWTISSSTGGETLLVRPNDEDRARTILRGILERTSAA
jgi:hypothetical protein